MWESLHKLWAALRIKSDLAVSVADNFLLS